MSLYSQLMGQTQQMQKQAQTPQINPQAVESVKRMVNMLQSSNNPEQAIQNLAQKNQQIGQLIQIANGHGGLKRLFFERAKQMGIDPNSVISQLK